MLKGELSYRQQLHNSKGQREPLPPCFKCAKSYHNAALHKFKNDKCHHCGKLGRIRPACKSREKTHHNPKKTWGCSSCTGRIQSK